FYTVEKYNDSLVFNDLRFGQELGWDNPHGKFAFHYYLQYPKENAMVVQRGRFAGWNSTTFRSFIKRVKGN
ncbi:MAG: metal-dependent hydrolase, partial [Sediminibacterium sp.]